MRIDKDLKDSIFTPVNKPFKLTDSEKEYIRQLVNAHNQIKDRNYVIGGVWQDPRSV